MIQIKRVYEAPAAQDGKRVLVERLWPRGLTRERAALDLWLKDVAPSPELRQWFAHDVQKWNEFQSRYRKELEANPGLIGRLHELASGGTLTLVYAASDQAHNSALLLKEFLEESVPQS